MARVGRLAGALLAETQGEYFLVGDTKSPCDWAASGFERPPESDAAARPFVRLSRRGEVDLGSPCLTMALEGEPLAAALARCFVIERNDSVSERLWRLVLQRGDPEADVPDGAVDARWLHELPGPIWEVVRSAVLRCT